MKEIIELHEMQCRECGGKETATIHANITKEVAIGFKTWFDNSLWIYGYANNDMNKNLETGYELTTSELFDLYIKSL